MCSSDLWRWSIEQKEKAVKDKISESAMANMSMQDRVKVILETIPKESKQIDSVKQSRQEIYYKLGESIKTNLMNHNYQMLFFTIY